MIHSALCLGSYNNFTQQLKADGVPQARARVAVTTAMAVLVLLFILEVVIVIYAIYVAYHCGSSDGMKVLWILAVLFIPFVSLGTAIYGLVSGCVPNSLETRSLYSKRSFYHGY